MVILYVTDSMRRARAFALRSAAAAACTAAATSVANCFTSGLPEDRFIARAKVAKDGNLLNHPSRWVGDKLVHSADEHPNTLAAATMIRERLAGFPALFRSDGTLSPPPPLRVASGKAGLSVAFTLPPTAHEPAVLLALLQQQGEGRSSEEEEEMLRHSAWVTEERGATCTHLRGAGGEYVLRRPKGVGATTLELECTEEGMMAETAATLVAAYEVAHGVVGGSAAASQPRRGTGGGNGHSVRRMGGGRGAHGGKAGGSQGEKAGGGRKERSGRLIGYDADVYNQEEEPAVDVLRELGCILFLPPALPVAETANSHAADGGAAGGSAIFTSSEGLAQERLDACAAGDERWGAGRWGGLVGYTEQKALVEESLLLPLLFPDAFDSVVAGTRDCAGASPDIRPKAILLHGAPGTGKTSCARAIAARSRLPLVYLPLEAVASKWYGEGEQKLAAVFDACGRLAREVAVEAVGAPGEGDSSGMGAAGPICGDEEASGGDHATAGHNPAVCGGDCGSGVVLLFLDEIDALAGARGSSSMHEATRRTLSVLLRKIDGFEADDAIVVIGATNRQQDLDSALLSRFDVAIHFPLPSTIERAAIFGRYARQLLQDSLERLATASGGLSGRNILDVCKSTERRWACKTIRDPTLSRSLPPEEEYTIAIEARQHFAAAARGETARGDAEA